MFINVNKFMLESFDSNEYSHFVFLTKIGNDKFLSKNIEKLDIESWKTKEDSSIYGNYLLYYNNINIGFTRFLNINNSLEIQYGIFEEYKNKKLDIIFLQEISNLIKNNKLQLNIKNLETPVFKQL